MNFFNGFFTPKQHQSQEHGGMLVELLLTIALAAIILPFIVQTQKSRIERAENILVAKQMETIKTAMERYIDINKNQLLKTVGKNITRVKFQDLKEYGIPEQWIEKYGSDIQLRILKSSDLNNRASLQGVIAMASKDISAIRTREIVNLGGDKIGFVEQGKAFGAFGTWKTNTVDLGVSGNDAIIGTTASSRGTDQYLHRVPSENMSDATMLSAMNLGGHNIINSKFMDSISLQIEEVIKSDLIISDKLVFQTKSMIDGGFETSDAVISGALSSDSRNMEISGSLTLSGTAKVSGLRAEELWAMNLNLSGLSVSGNSEIAILKVNQATDISRGHIKAMSTTVGFDGSITPKLIVQNRIEDSANPGYYWDASARVANLYDVTFTELNRMAPEILKKETSGNASFANQTFKKVVTNKNATASDYMNAISEIQKRVESKYRQLNLE